MRSSKLTQYLAAAVAVFTAAGMGIAQAATVPHNEDFEGFGAAGTDMDGTGDWTSTSVDNGSGVSGRALISSGDISNLTASVTNADLNLTFSDDKTVSYVEFETIPFFGPAADIPVDASVVFYVNATGSVVAYNGTSPSVLSHTPVTSNATVTFGVSCDYVGETYNLLLDGVKIAAGYGFYSSSNSDFNVFAVRADSGDNVTYLDNFAAIISDPNFIATNAVPETPGSDDVTIVLDNVSPGNTYRLIASDGNPDGPYVQRASQTFSGAPPYMLVDPGVLGDEVTTRYYRVVDTASGETNETTWVMQRRPRDTASWYVLGAPIQFGDGAENDLSGELGAQLARGVVAGGTFPLATKLYVQDSNGDITDIFYLDSGRNGWVKQGELQLATNSVPPGSAFWLNTPAGQGLDRTVFTGYEHGTSSVVRLVQDKWMAFSWPFATRTAGETGSGGQTDWGIENAGGTANNSFLNSDQIYHPGLGRILWLSDSGGWQIRGGHPSNPSIVDAGSVTFEPGDAYFYFNRGTTFNWTPEPPL